MRNVVKNTILVGISEIASKGIIALAMILLVRTLAPASYGLYSLSITLTYFFIGFLHSGFYTIGMRELAKYPHLANKYFGNITTLKIIVSIISYLILFIIVLVIDKPEDAKVTFLLSGLFIFILIFHIDWLFRGLDKMEITSIGSILQGVTLLLLIFFIVRRENDYQKAVIAYLISWLIFVLFEMVVYFKQNKSFKIEFDRNFVKPLVKSALPISFSALVIFIYANNNILFLNFFKGDYETGIYSAMVRLMNLLLLPNSILQIAFFPELSRSVLSGELKISQESYLKVLFTIGFLGIFGMFGYSKEIIQFAFGEKYLVGDTILRVSLIACLFSYLSSSFVMVSIIIDKQKNFLFASIGGAIISLIINYLIVPIYGALGAVITLNITEVMVFFILTILNKDTSIIEPYRKIIKPFLVGIVAIATSKLFEFLFNPTIGMILFVFLFILLAFLTKLVTVELIKKVVKLERKSQ